MLTQEEKLQSTYSVQESGWEAIREIIGDFLIIVLGTWLMARGMLSLIAVFHESGGPPVLWLVLQLMTSIGIISLGVDRWREHSKASYLRLPDRPHKKRWYEDDDEDEK